MSKKKKVLGALIVGTVAGVVASVLLHNRKKENVFEEEDYDFSDEDFDDLDDDYDFDDEDEFSESDVPLDVYDFPKDYEEDLQSGEPEFPRGSGNFNPNLKNCDDLENEIFEGGNVNNFKFNDSPSD